MLTWPGRTVLLDKALIHSCNWPVTTLLRMFPVLTAKTLSRKEEMKAKATLAAAFLGGLSCLFTSGLNVLERRKLQTDETSLLL